MTTRLARLQKQRRHSPNEIVQRNGWQFFSPYFAPPDVDNENLEDLESIENPLPTYVQDEIDYSQDISTWMK
jgi:hypothetical protein